MYQPYAIYMLPVESIITSPHNWLLAFKKFSVASKESKLQPSQPGLGVISQQSICYKSAPSCHNNHTATITYDVDILLFRPFWLPICKWVHHPNSNPTQHLSLCEIAVDSRQSPYLLRVTIKQSKTDPFYQDVHLFLGKTSTVICPVNGMMPYLGMWGAQAGPLFINTDRKQLTWQLLSSNLKTILQKMKWR